MKIVFIHIPKTAGSTVSSLLYEPSVSGEWLMERDLWDQPPEQLWANDVLAGHFTRNHLREYVKRHGLSMDGVKLVTMVREPISQLRSNLNFPMELAARALPEGWMRAWAIARPTATEIIDFLETHPWLLNMQTEYLRLDGAMVEPSDYDFIGVFPGDIDRLTKFIAAEIGLQLPPDEIHENAAQNFLDRDVFSEPPLCTYLTQALALDIGLYRRLESYRNLASTDPSDLDYLKTLTT